VNRVAVLVVFGLLTASVANAARSRPLPWVLDYATSIRDNADAEARLLISYEELVRRFSAPSAAFIDARSADVYAQGHLPGAFNVPSSDIENHMGVIYENVPPDKLIIIYCDGGNCEASHHVAAFLAESKFRNVRIFKEGWERLGRGDLPIITGDSPFGEAGGEPGGEPADSG
jgi:rhodanese-related sulfurtransferase